MVGGKLFEFQGIDFWRELAKANYETLRSFDKDNSIEIHVSEWNLTSKLFEYQHDTSDGSAYCCQAISDVYPYVDTFSYWTISDVLRELRFPNKEFHGDFGLITVHKLKKPKFWTFKMLNKLKGQRILVLITDSIKGIGSLATKTKEGLYIVIWYYNPEWDVKKEPVKISLECNSLPFKNISITRSLIDDSHSNITNIVIEKSITGWPTDEELEEPRRLNSLYEEREHKELEDGRYRYEATLMPGIVLFLELEPLLS
jgi:xylan 1,4-beta-xylosidase